MAVMRLPPWQLVRVSGPSMVPTLRHGDVVLVRARRADPARRRGAGPVPRAARPAGLKRAVRAEDGGWWLASDNSFAGGDSETHGVADVVGRVVLRLARPAATGA